MQQEKLDKYRDKRHFERTPEPAGHVEPSEAGRLYVIQKHAASHLHYDLRLELDGVLKSWAVPKGPSLNPADKRLAVHVEDHPIDYGSFEGTIPEGEYGGGTVMLWDRGRWEPEGDPNEGYAKGNLKFRIIGEKLRGSWVLARMKGDPGEGGKNWLLIKHRDETAISGSGPNPVEQMDRSVSTGRTMQEIADEQASVWHDKEATQLAENSSLTAPKSERTKTAKAKSPRRKKTDPFALPGARPAPLPATFRPELATLVSKPPEGDNWLHEIKYDGYRILCVVSGKSARLISRNGNDWTQKFPGIADGASRLDIDSGILDGEVVVVDPAGRTDFQALQNILKGIRSGRLVFYAFDLPYYNGYDLTQTPLVERKKILQQMLANQPRNGSTLLYTDHIFGQGGTVFGQACRFALEGVISKQVDSSYQQKRTRNWLKVKCYLRQEFVVGGFTEPGGSRTGFGALLVGYYNPDRRLIFAGRVGTGFNDRTLKDIYARLTPIETGNSPFVNPPTGYEAKGVHWITPELVAEIEFGSWTDEGILRHPSFKGLRDDRDPTEIVRETPEGAPPEPSEQNDESTASPARQAASARWARGTGDPGAVNISNPDRLLYSEQLITKRELADYYVDIAEWILPNLVGRPLTLVRCPEGWEKECFYQKHLGDTASSVLRSIPVLEKNGLESYSVIENMAGLIALVQVGTLEIHVWGCREKKIEQPDMMVFDLDPDPGVPWDRMIRSARLMRDSLSDLGLESFLKTTGGKGLHVVTPLTPRLEWDTVKEFSKAIADSLVREFPREYIATMSKAKRKGKIFIDFLRNGRGATSIAAFSTRARSGAPVAAPIGWDELTEDLRPDAFNIRNIRQRLSSLRKDPWEDYFKVRQTITAKMLKKMGINGGKSRQ